MYSLEYEALIRVLRQLGFSGEFYADISSQAALKNGGRVILIVQNGNVTSCFILNRNGQKLHHDAEAQHLLAKLGILEWKRASATTTENLTAPPVAALIAKKSTDSNGYFIPQQHLRVPEAQMRTWSMLERSVYFLADGKHSIEQIAKLLSRPITAIEQIIYRFEASGIIVRL